jgi:uncharacterized protein YuzB (UPF0349 family)
MKACLGYYNDCSSHPFSLLDKKLLQANTPEELYDLLVKATGA